jgi:hypothetical protein
MRLLRSTAFIGLVVLARCVGGDDTNTSDAGKDSSIPDNNVPDTAPPQDSGPDGSGNCTTAPTTDFYVDPVAGSDSASGAGASCALKTITAALTKSSSNYNAILHLAAGTYGPGETFPLIVDKGRSLVGAGASTTKIQGSSAAFNTTNTGAFLDGAQTADAGLSHFFVTMIAGDTMGGSNNLGATTISGVTILPAANITTPTAQYVGLACLAGNGPATGTTPPLPTANLVVKGVTIGPNYDTAFAIGSEPTNQTSCNASVITSTITGSNLGISTGTCGTANPTTSWPSSQIGDGQPNDANTFSANAIGIISGGCGSVQSYHTNKFVSGTRGIVMISNTGQYFEVLANTFDGSTSPFLGVGIHMGSGTVIAKLDDNTFTNIGETSGADAVAGFKTGYGMIMGGYDVAQAQRNVFHDNDNGLWMANPPGPNFDFSNDGVLNNRNQFYCNSKTTTQTGNGYDLLLGYTSSPHVAKFTGNQWDHAGPTSSVSNTTSPNGTDNATNGVSNLDVSSYGLAVGATCSAGRSL